MARAQDDSSSLRFGRRETVRLVAALVLSLCAHLIVWGGYHLGHKLNLWQNLHTPAWLAPLTKKVIPNKPPPQNEEPTTFVDVSHADADAPVKPKYYSYRNSRAANPVEANENIPEISGKQKDVPKTEDVPKLVKKSENTPEEPSKPQVAKAQPLMPTPPSPESQQPQTPGETELLHKDNNAKPQPNPEKPQPERPRTLKQARALQHQLPGEMMRQAGGVSRHANSTSLDVKATSFGEYDWAIVQAVTQHWYDLLDKNRYADDRNGKVTVQFKLMSDGAVVEVQTVENSVGPNLGMLCVDAIEESAPFAKWPSDMLREIGENSRVVTFTFYYY